jgi:nicotinate-nucleotide--dimethylbenzimidazole phosphoribosyltransferase
MNRLDVIRSWANDRGINTIKEPVAVIVQDTEASLHPVLVNAEVNIDTPALPEGVSDAWTAGQQHADRIIDAGTNLIAVAGLDPMAAMTAIGVLTKSDAAAVLGLPVTGSDDVWMDTCARIRDRMHVIRPEAGEPHEFLIALDSPSVAYLTALISRACERETIVLIDGLTATAAALIVRRIHPDADRWWLHAHVEDHVAHGIALERLDAQPMIDLQLRDNPGVATTLTLPIVRAALLG